MGLKDAPLPATQFQIIQGDPPACSQFPLPPLGLDTLVFHMGKELGEVSFDLSKALGRNVPSCPFAIPLCSLCSHRNTFPPPLKQQASASGMMPSGADFQV